jgi:hypothetical protein
MSDTPETDDELITKTSENNNTDSDFTEVSVRQKEDSDTGFFDLPTPSAPVVT